MYIVAIILLAINFLFMLLFYVKIRRNFSRDKYEALMKERMNAILRDFNFQTNQAVTVLEERIDEMKELIADADRRFVALSKKMNASSKQNEMLKNEMHRSEIFQNEVMELEEKTCGTDALLNERKSDVIKVGLKHIEAEKTSQQVVQSTTLQDALPKIPSYEDLRPLQQDASQNDAIIKMKVVEMSKNGWSVEFIANKLKLPLEEVKIITFMAKTQE